MFEQYTLKNKARVILVPQHDTQSVTVLVKYPLGSRYEPEKLSGVSHFIEHMMFKGTNKRKNTLILTREIDRLGAEYNAFTSKEYTGYYIKTDAKYAEIALDILSDMLFHSNMETKEMEREKGPVCEELRMYRDNPLMNISNVFEELMYDGCPLGRDIGGTVDHVKSYKPDDVRAFKEKFYVPSNMTIIVAGKIDENTRACIETYFGSEPSGHAASKAFKPSVFGSSKKADRLVVHEKKTDQAQLMLGFPGFEYTSPQNPVLYVMDTILGGSMSSRLFIQIRERRGLAYMIKTGADHCRDTGYFFARAGLEAKNINKAISVITSEIEKLIEKGVTARELANAKTHIRGELTLSMEDSSAQANWYGSEALFFPKIKTPEEYLASIEKVTAGEIKALAKKLFKFSEMRVAIIGEVNEKDVRF